MLTRYDARLAMRAAALGMALVGVALVVMLASDEGAGRIADRLGRLSALAPFAGGVGAWIAAAQARSRGELLALAAVGASPRRAVCGAVIGGAFVGALGGTLLLASAIDLGPLFPAVPHMQHWRAAGPQVFEDAARGIAVWSNGVIVRMDAVVESGVTAGTGAEDFRLPTGIAILLTSVAVPSWGVITGSFGRRLGVGLFLGIASVFAFHAVAAHHAPAFLLALAPALLLLDAWLLHQAARWS